MRRQLQERRLLAQQRSRSKNASSSEEEEEDLPGSSGSPSAPKWWHVRDDVIYELVKQDALREQLRDQAVEEQAGRLAATFGSLPVEKALRATAASEDPRSSTKHSVRFQDADALDSLLKRTLQAIERHTGAWNHGKWVPGPRKRPPPRAPSKDSWRAKAAEDSEPPSKWWRVSDEQLQLLIEELASAPTEKTSPPARTSQEPGSPTSSPSSSPSRSSSLRLPTLEVVLETQKMPLNVFVAETGDMVKLRVHPDSSLGPTELAPARPEEISPLPASPNRGSYKGLVGPGVPAGQVDMRSGSKRLSFNRFARQSAPAETLMRVVERGVGVPPHRQRLFYRGGALSANAMTLRAYGIAPGETITLYVEPDPVLCLPKWDVTLARSQRRDALADAARQGGQLGRLRRSRSEPNMWTAPRWTSREQKAGTELGPIAECAATPAYLPGGGGYIHGAPFGGVARAAQR